MNCTTFQNQFGQINTELLALSDGIEKYMSDPAANSGLPDRFSQLAKQREDFITEYQSAAKAILRHWLVETAINPLWRAETQQKQRSGMQSLANKFIESLEFEDSGRILVNNPDGQWSLRGHTITRFPALIRKLNTSLDLGPGSPIEDIDYLEESTRALHFEGAINLKTIKSLKRAYAIDLRKSGIQTLDSLEEVEGMLTLNRAADFESAPNLRKVGNLVITDTKIKTFEDFKKAFPKLEEAESMTVPNNEIAHFIKILVDENKFKCDQVFAVRFGTVVRVWSV